ncbi:hypothetical protein ACFQX6_04425 [Streptosporangium lutulentum]
MYSTTAGKGGVQTVNVSANGRFVRLYTTKRSGQYGVSLWEFQVFGTGSGTSNPLPRRSPAPPRPPRPRRSPAAPRPRRPRRSPVPPRPLPRLPAAGCR